MDTMTFETLLLRRDGPTLHVTLNRPEQRNAINGQMARELAAVVERLPSQSATRVVVLRGAGGNFCAGGDIKERRAEAENEVGASDPLMERNRRAGLLFRAFERLPQTTIAVVEGAAFGGGLGYACLTDITIVAQGARLGMPETSIGVAPAQIAPFVVRRIGLTRARQLALTAERFDGAKALEYGIAHYLGEDHEIDGLAQEVIAKVLRCGPQANAVTKKIMLAVGTMPEEELIRHSAELFAELNRGAEGREGQAAFAEKRKPNWQVA